MRLDARVSRLADGLASRVSATQIVEASDGPTAYVRRRDHRSAPPVDRALDLVRSEPWPGHPERTPAAGVLVCAGDSITMGMFSASYVALLRRRFPRMHVVNAGINGNLAYNVAERLDAIVACHPDAVTVLVGTNDVNVTMGESWARRYRRQQSLPRDPDLDWYGQSIARILDGLQERTEARLAVLDLPMLGEDLTSPINATIARYNERLQAVAGQRGVPVLPLHDHLVALLDPAAAPPAYEGSLAPAFRAGVRRFLLRRSWDDAARAEGLALLTDHIHLNDRAAAEVAELIADFVAAEAG